MARILLVEDNDLNADMLSRRLSRRGHDVHVVGDGEAAVEAVRAEPPDVVLMDISLPKMDGWEATRILKGDDVTKGVPILALTAHALPHDRDKSLEVGCDDFDTKPIDLTRLLAKIDALLER